MEEVAEILRPQEGERLFVTTLVNLLGSKATRF